MIELDVWDNWSDGAGDPLSNRVWYSQLPSTLSSDGDFLLATYNILSEVLLKKSSYFSNIKPENWDRNYRHERLMEELHFINADVFCLQEVDESYFESMLDPDFARNGYRGHLATRTDNSGVGVATFFRTTIFDQIDSDPVVIKKILEKYLVETGLTEECQNAVLSYVDEANSGLVSVCKFRNSDRQLCIGNLHVSYAKHRKLDLRCAEVVAILNALCKLSKERFKTTDSKNKETLPSHFILCGDFNSTPDSAVYQLCRDGFLNEHNRYIFESMLNISIPGISECDSLINLLGNAFKHQCCDLRSCYYEVLGREPPMTLNLSSNHGCLDYIWLSGSGLSPTSVLLPRSLYQKELQGHLPNSELPSDHLSLACKFEFV